jgi:hypothetical protein
MKNPEIKKRIISLRNKFKPILKHFPVIIFVLIAGFLIYGVLTVTQILNRPIDQAYLDEQQKNNALTRFDEQTIEKVKNLKNRQENPNLTLPGNKRINPFTE